MAELIINLLMALTVIIRILFTIMIFLMIWNGVLLLVSKIKDYIAHEKSKDK